MPLAALATLELVVLIAPDIGVSQSNKFEYG